jgi:hypothetical protein
MSPATLPRSFVTHAIEPTEPLGFGSEQHLAAPLELGDLLGRGIPAAVVMLDRDAEPVARRRSGEPRRVVLDDQGGVVAAEAQAGVGAKDARQESGLGEHLETVADAEDGAARVGVRAHGGHRRRQRGQGAAAEVVAEREPARDDHGVGAVEGVVAVPDADRLRADELDGPKRVAVVARAGEDEHADPGHAPTR